MVFSPHRFRHIPFATLFSPRKARWAIQKRAPQLAKTFLDINGEHALEPLGLRYRARLGFRAFLLFCKLSQEHHMACFRPDTP
jgi:hypothetical protein